MALEEEVRTARHTAFLCCPVQSSAVSGGGKEFVLFGSGARTDRVSLWKRQEGEGESCPSGLTDGNESKGEGCRLAENLGLGVCQDLIGRNLGGLTRAAGLPLHESLGQALVADQEMEGCAEEVGVVELDAGALIAVVP